MEAKCIAEKYNPKEARFIEYEIEELQESTEP